MKTVDGSPVKPFVESFWVWKQFSFYVKTLFVMGVTLMILTYFGHSHKWFNVALGTLSSGIEVSKNLKVVNFSAHYLNRPYLEFLNSGSIAREATLLDWRSR